tara:strand:- start:3811 stop:5562 length:1752 start_codon:yes stop_codon:yes gene_type:complete
LKSNISLLGNKWVLLESDERTTLMISQRYSISPTLSKLLINREINEETIEQYLNPDLYRDLPNPFKLKDMDKSINRIITAIENNEKIGIIADYDVDGATSSAILSKFFHSIKIKPLIKIPNRLTEGYGPNNRIMNDFIEDNINLVFSLDCGTNAFEIFNNSKYKHLDIIIVDHHISESYFPNVYSIINPNRFDEKGEYKNLAAVGVTFMLLLGLRKKLRDINFFKKNHLKEPNLLYYLDLVALGTICDIVVLKDYNRLFVNKGLEIIKKRNNIAINTLIDDSNLFREPKASDLGYIIGPKLNAASRIDNSNLAFKILISNNISDIQSISRKLTIFNEKRKLIENQVYEKCYSKAIKNKNKKIIIVHEEDLHLGILGIVASRLVKEFSKPVIIISFLNNLGVGSARSIENFNLFNLLDQAKKQKILISSGGHEMAGGLKIDKKHLKKFINFTEEFISKFDNIYQEKLIYCDNIILTENVNEFLLEDIEKLEPFGNGNLEPKFIIKDIKIDFVKKIKNKHLLLNISHSNSNHIKGICFNSINQSLGDNLLNYKNKKIDILCSITKEYFQGSSKPQIIIYDAIISN